MTAVLELGDLTPAPATSQLLRLSRPAPVWVYSHIDASGAVLYIGCTCQPTQRLKEHRRNSRWYPEVTEVRYLGPFEVFDGARVEERLIQHHQPAFNRQHRTSAAAQPAGLQLTNP